MKAKIEIRIWNEDEEQPSTSDLTEMFQTHVEHVASQLAEGYQAGQIIGDTFSGWWEILS